MAKPRSVNQRLASLEKRMIRMEKTHAAKMKAIMNKLVLIQRKVSR
jgi:hypothetical protein